MYKRFLLIAILLLGSGCVNVGEEPTTENEESKIPHRTILDIVEHSPGSETPVNKLTMEQLARLIAGDMELDEINALVENNELTHLDLDLIAGGYRSVQEFELAEKYLKKAIELDESFGDHYGNLMSLYVELERFDETEELYNTAMEKAIFGREFVYFHQTRAFLLNEDVSSAANTCLQGIDEMEQLREFIEPYENLYFSCIKSLEVLIGEQQNQNLPDETILETATQLSELMYEGLDLFPDSERIQEVYNYYEE